MTISERRMAPYSHLESITFYQFRPASQYHGEYPACENPGCQQENIKAKHAIYQKVHDGYGLCNIVCDDCAAHWQSSMRPFLYGGMQTADIVYLNTP